MEAEASDTTGDSGDDSDDDGGGGDDGTSQFDNDNGNDIGSDDVNNDGSIVGSDNNITNGDRDNLIDYLQDGKGDVSEATNWGLNTQEQEQLNTTIQAQGLNSYLSSQKSDNNQEFRQLYNEKSEEITKQEANQQIGQDKFIAVIYNPELDFKNEELHELANKIIDNKRDNLIKLEQNPNDLQALYAIHHRADNTNPHIHIVFHSKTNETLKNAKIDSKDMTKEQLKNWIIERSEIVDSVKPISEVEKARNVERLNTIESKNRQNGTQQRDSMIDRYMGKEAHNMGNFSLTQLEISLKESVKNGLMSEKTMQNTLKQVESRVNTHIKNGLAEKVDSKHFVFNREAFTNMRIEYDKSRAEKIESKNIQFLENRAKTQAIQQIQKNDSIYQRDIFVGKYSQAYTQYNSKNVNNNSINLSKTNERVQINSNIAVSNQSGSQGSENKIIKEQYKKELHNSY